LAFQETLAIKKVLVWGEAMLAGRELRCLQFGTSADQNIHLGPSLVKLYMVQANNP
jgi:hypothetical protein